MFPIFFQKEVVDLILPVPLFWKKRLRRGFNQSALLAKRLARSYDISFSNSVLIKNRQTRDQVMLGKKERVVNLKGAFSVKRKAQIFQKRILLVDDVYTTGSTVDECSKVLIESGAQDVLIYTLARSVVG
jgi:ComF family protein